MIAQRSIVGLNIRGRLIDDSRDRSAVLNSFQDCLAHSAESPDRALDETDVEAIKAHSITYSFRYFEKNILSLAPFVSPVPVQCD